MNQVSNRVADTFGPAKHFPGPGGGALAEGFQAENESIHAIIGATGAVDVFVGLIE
jgi:hypothetical protein